MEILDHRRGFQVRYAAAKEASDAYHVVGNPHASRLGAELAGATEALIGSMVCRRRGLPSRLSLLSSYSCVAANPTEWQRDHSAESFV